MTAAQDQKRRRLDALDRLSRLRVGDPVRVTQDGRVMEMAVTREAHRCDGEFGSWESTRVTVSYGPGRYAFDVGVEGLADGRVSIEASA